jgi:hypothetical protein
MSRTLSTSTGRHSGTQRTAPFAPFPYTRPQRPLPRATSLAPGHQQGRRRTRHRVRTALRCRPAEAEAEVHLPALPSGGAGVPTCTSSAAATRQHDVHRTIWRCCSNAPRFLCCAPQAPRCSGPAWRGEEAAQAACRLPPARTGRPTPGRCDQRPARTLLLSPEDEEHRSTAYSYSWGEDETK